MHGDRDARDLLLEAGLALSSERSLPAILERIVELSSDPRSVGFPPNHPPMRWFLGAPVMARGQVFGNIYLTEKRGAAGFDADDEQALVILAGRPAWRWRRPACTRSCWRGCSAWTCCRPSAPRSWVAMTRTR